MWDGGDLAFGRAQDTYPALREPAKATPGVESRAEARVRSSFRLPGEVPEALPTRQPQSKSQQIGGGGGGG
ncbi:hypothetical protein CGCA056_v014866 [Colletotrichum aenigma]|uniref:uncharacterized protein n=1 Tax=Colletotrichum aenigma TaxID=1215731 RepID=UPI0018724DBB|nr:uncharacterized protein CGCA056_v014866 [Colletotrichum aenigma]KAF5502137.1 hypothetical protein CGCA056_v014866 [Colletotrichum aenigma]